jgi:hypothetical protein
MRRILSGNGSEAGSGQPLLPFISFPLDTWQLPIPASRLLERKPLNTL